jgi:hypothetical protein
MLNIFKPKRKIDYTHWDIHAMARILDPKAWAEFDAAGHSPNEYVTFAAIRPSFDMAVNALKHGVKATKEHLWSHTEVFEQLPKVK